MFLVSNLCTFRFHPTIKTALGHYDKPLNEVQHRDFAQIEQDSIAGSKNERITEWRNIAHFG